MVRSLLAARINQESRLNFTINIRKMKYIFFYLNSSFMLLGFLAQESKNQ